MTTNSLLSTEDFLEFIGQHHWEIDNCLCIKRVNFDVTKFLSLVASSSLYVVSTNDGPYSIVKETGNYDDFSQRTDRFDWHTDGLYYEKVPEYVILYCDNPGNGSTPTVFTDTRAVVSNLMETQAFNILNQLETVYIDKAGELFSRALLEKHPITQNLIINLGSRVYLRPIVDVTQISLTPSLRDMLTASQTLLKEIDSHIVLRHNWKMNDLIIFDNNTFLHGREAQTADPARTLLRIWLSRK
jgi:alpha-ketoglutarate-dependent taurine dioxygenase